MNKSFFKKPALEVAPKLLGQKLVRKLPNGEIIRSEIVEVEAYLGEEDLASHAHKGRTLRNEVMYQEGGVWYVYLIYGMHHMINVVTGEKNEPSAVLIRGTKDIQGPGRLTKYFDIDKGFNTLSINKENKLWIEKGREVQENEIVRSPRIGVEYAKDWSKKPYRFSIML